MEQSGLGRSHRRRISCCSAANHGRDALMVNTNLACALLVLFFFLVHENNHIWLTQHTARTEKIMSTGARCAAHPGVALLGCLMR